MAQPLPVLAARCSTPCSGISPAVLGRGIRSETRQVLREEPGLTELFGRCFKVMNFSSETPCRLEQSAFSPDSPYHSSRFSGIQLRFHTSSPRQPRSVRKLESSAFMQPRRGSLVGSPGDVLARFPSPSAPRLATASVRGQRVVVPSQRATGGAQGKTEERADDGLPSALTLRVPRALPPSPISQASAFSPPADIRSPAAAVSSSNPRGKPG